MARNGGRRGGHSMGAAHIKPPRDGRHAVRCQNGQACRFSSGSSGGPAGDRPAPAGRADKLAGLLQLCLGVPRQLQSRPAAADQWPVFVTGDRRIVTAVAAALWPPLDCAKNEPALGNRRHGPSTVPTAPGAPRRAAASRHFYAKLASGQPCFSRRHSLAWWTPVPPLGPAVQSQPRRCVCASGQVPRRPAGGTIGQPSESNVRHSWTGLTAAAVRPDLAVTDRVGTWYGNNRQNNFDNH